MPKRRLKGKIVSNKMKNTVVVEVERILAHPKYKKRYKKHKKYKAHAIGAEYNIGDKVTIEECKPMSKDKHFKVIKVDEPKDSSSSASVKDGLDQ